MQFTNRKLTTTSRAALSVALTVIAGALAPAPVLAQSDITTFASPFMDAADTPLAEIANGAKVGPDTAAYWNLPVDSPQRTSYDKDIIVEVAEGVWTIGTDSIVNVQVVEGPEGLIIYDTGDNAKEGLHVYEMLRTVTQAPVRAIIYSHEHYIAGTQAFLNEEAKRGNTDIKIVGHPMTNESMIKTSGLVAMHPEVTGVLMARTIEQFNIFLPDEGPDSRFKNTILPATGEFVAVDTPVQDGQKMRLAGLEVEFFTDGINTDSNNQVMAWLPERGIALNNVAWGWFPNIYSVRGGRYRNPEGWVNAVDKLRDLDPDILLTTHATSLADKDAIQARLQDYRDGLSFVLDQTLKAILLGQGPDELQYAVTMPDRLQNSPILVKNYGEVMAMPPRIFTGVFGQYDRNAANLVKLHPTEEAQRMVKAMGGEDATYQLSKAAFEDGDFLWSCQLADYVLKANDVQTNRQLKADCLRQMGYRALSTNSRSWYLSQALELEGKTAILRNVPADPAAISANLADYVNYYRVRISADRSAQVDKVLGLDFGEGRVMGLHIRQSVVDFLPDLGAAPKPADVTLSLTPDLWTAIYNNLADPAALIEAGQITVTQGDGAEAADLFALFDPIYDWANDPALQALAEMMKPAQ